MERIKQIIPADGWSAVYAERVEGGNLELNARPMACWGLTEDGERVVGMDASDAVDTCEDNFNFVRYVHESQDVYEECYREAAEVLQREERRGD